MGRDFSPWPLVCACLCGLSGILFLADCTAGHTIKTYSAPLVFAHIQTGSLGDVIFWFGHWGFCNDIAQTITSWFCEFPWCGETSLNKTDVNCYTYRQGGLDDWSKEANAGKMVYVAGTASILLVIIYIVSVTKAWVSVVFAITCFVSCGLGTVAFISSLFMVSDVREALDPNIIDVHMGAGSILLLIGSILNLFALILSSRWAVFNYRSSGYETLKQERCPPPTAADHLEDTFEAAAPISKPGVGQGLAQPVPRQPYGGQVHSPQQLRWPAAGPDEQSVQ